MENIAEIVSAAQNMVDRVALFCEENAKVKAGLESVLRKFDENTDRLMDGRQSIVKAAWQAIDHGIAKPTKHALPPVGGEIGE
jgi:DNA anti-recombination protein RmuC